MKPQPLIAGVHEFPERKTSKSMLEIQALSARAALEDAGLSKKDVDGFFTVAANAGIGPLPIVDYLNLNPTYIDGTTIGGSSFDAHVNHAAAAIAQGRCRVALITYGSTSRSSGVAVGTRERISGDSRSRASARASIWRTRSRVRLKCRPTSSSVRWRRSMRP